ncbi:N-acetylneuraminate synthase [Fulvivirga lutea]|uniref:N-acetylneuraminate synthase n=1 Tax=Fulvivirga lutea TaxID=2810512 RepID=A0A974ZZY9_9BACT|nr:N-acetylneuraminate synthase [Fulvivirga lutea]QSE96819.1 N-acetylneuraminate synthase [Fulvivirga lutea]
MSNKVIIIAEAGVNHNGDMSLAKKLIEKASKAGADYVKFQSFHAEKLVSKEALKAEYQAVNTNDGHVTQFEMLKKLELSNTDHKLLIDHCNECGIKFLSTAFDVEGIHYLNGLNIDFFKCPSGEITNFPYLKTVAKTGKPVVLSTGMATLDEVEDAVNVLKKYGQSNSKITLLHCNTEYPTPMNDVNLKAMLTMAHKLNLKVGYSDHTLGIEVPVAAVALGACIIEKHFTLDRTLPGPDHKASLEPEELFNMVRSIRNIEMAISKDGLKEPSPSELKNISIARKSIHLSKDIDQGMVLAESDLIPLRPGDGISPMLWNEVIGKTTNKKLKAFTKVKWEDIQ